MEIILDLSRLETNRIFVVGELNGDHAALMRLLYQQRFGYADTLITTGNFFNVNNMSSLDLTVFLRNAVSCYSVLGEQEIKLLEYLEDPEKEVEIRNKMKNKLNDYCLEYIRECPLVIKYRDYYIMNAGVDPSKCLEDQDPTVYYSIGEYDKDSRFYQYSNPEKSSWYNTPYLVNGKHVKICFSRIFLNDIEVPAGYNLGRNLQTNSNLRCLVIDRTQGTPSIITST
jgi:hypothetical protein